MCLCLVLVVGVVGVVGVLEDALLLEASKADLLLKRNKDLLPAISLDDVEGIAMVILINRLRYWGVVDG